MFRLCRSFISIPTPTARQSDVRIVAKEKGRPISDRLRDIVNARGHKKEARCVKLEIERVVGKRGFVGQQSGVEEIGP